MYVHTLVARGYVRTLVHELDSIRKLVHASIS